MSTKTRPRRLAGSKKKYIEISESETDSDVTSPMKICKRNAKPKTQSLENVVLNKLSMHNELSPSSQNGNGIVNRSPQKSARSSFWARRKVWTIPELLAETEQIEPYAAKNIVNLLEHENTIPFICRYRRDLINHINPERLRDIKNSYTQIAGLRKKAETIVSQLEKERIIDENLRNELLCAKSSAELDFLYAPYKLASKGSLAERAKALGLETYANQLLFGEAPVVQLERIVQRNNSDLDSTDKILKGILHIMSHNISKNTCVLEELRRLREIHRIMLICVKGKVTNAAKENKSDSRISSKNKNNDATKFETYFNFESDIKTIKPHQILAINRGEKLKFLRVKLIIPNYLKNDLKYFIKTQYMNDGLRYSLREKVFDKAFDDCFNKKLQPLLSRQIRANLTAMAHKASIDVFASNLKQLLLTSPLKGECILGIDPGFSNGCKLALVSETGDVLETGVIYPHTRDNNIQKNAEKLINLLARHNCKIIALGNGTACRETEFWLTKLFEKGLLDARHVRYSIVSECGASIYSCSDVARKEFPNMDMNQISAVSIARRLNDPLSEYVKIEPKHLGVGMYQHDINEKNLTEALNEVVSECVSYVGVDINTASLSVLKHISGLTEKKAEKIIEHRSKKGPFRTRRDLLDVKTIGDKTFVQCAGFVRIDPLSSGTRLLNPLDCTWVHPESYTMAQQIIKKCNLRLEHIGQEDFIKQIEVYGTVSNMSDLANEFKTPIERVEIVIEALQRKLFEDYRTDLDKKPLFKRGITKLTEVNKGDLLTGAVTNITHFGAFIDVGVECDGLLHISQMNNAKLRIGDRVTVLIIEVDVQRNRLSLRLENMLHERNT